jgi:SAM-dependent methyltransferase
LNPEFDPRSEFVAALEESLAKGTFVKLTLAKYRGPDKELKAIYVRSIQIKSADQLSFLTRYRTRDVTTNYSVAHGVSEIRSRIGDEFLNAHLFTLENDFVIEFNRKREARLVSNPPSFEVQPAATHDRAKRRLIELEGNIYLKALGVTNERGEVLRKQGDKYRQINRFVELVSGLFDSSRLSDRKEISIVDMGAGKGYLTFGIYDFFRRTRGLSVSVTGVEMRPELVAKGNEVASLAGFDRLVFKCGEINSFVDDSMDILIALHACDTATDDAIYKGIETGAEIIIAAPCCHKELRPQIKAPDVLRGVLRHGLLLEREAEAVTDGIRALLLERSGYAVKVFEFISTEHTRKNTMIAAVRRKANHSKADASRDQLQTLKAFYGIREQRLEKLLEGQVE